MKKVIPVLAIFIAAILFAKINTVAAQPVETDAQDCKEYGVDYKQTEGLTKAEIAERMDNALFKSLNKYDECLQQSQSGGATPGSAASGGEAGTETGAAGSMASTGIQGTEKNEAAENVSPDVSNLADTVANDNGKKQDQKQTQALNNGKLPEDIPQSDNDSILQQKVKEAAMNEPDPVKRAKLWNEYRKLKGLPQKELPQI